jgi:nucleoside-diphosphate-sugar epimerase
MNNRSKVVLLTGFPSSFLARRLLKKILITDRDSRVRCLTPQSAFTRAEKVLSTLNDSDRKRVELLRGGVADMDFGLSGANFLSLSKEVDVIHHCAAIDYPGVTRYVTERINIKGTGEVLELAENSAHLDQLVYWSTALVAGSRPGSVMEDELVRPPSFRNVVEETRFRAEKVVRDAMGRVRTTIIRPSVVVGDAEGWKTDRLNGPYLLIKFILNAPFDITVPLPKRGEVSINQVPVGYVVDAAIAIASDRQSIGRTFHVIDPNPPSLRDVCLATAKIARRPLTIGELPTGFTTAIMQTPGIKQLSDIPRTYFEQLSVDVRYDASNTRDLLKDTAIACPTVDSYLEPLVEYLRDSKSEPPKHDEEGPFF